MKILEKPDILNKNDGLLNEFFYIANSISDISQKNESITNELSEKMFLLKNAQIAVAMSAIAVMMRPIGPVANRSATPNARIAPAATFVAMVPATVATLCAVRAIVLPASDAELAPVAAARERQIAV